MKADKLWQLGKSRLLGDLVARLGRPEMALDRYAQALREAPEASAVYRRLAQVLRAHPETPAARAIDDQVPSTLALFVGYPRSGHSLVGSLLDAHPQVALAHELNTLQRVAEGVSGDELLRFMKINAYFFARLGRTWTGYDYQIPGQYQGRYTQLAVLGDKKGAGTARHLLRHPALLDELEARSPAPLAFVHVVRHPLDNIATWARRRRLSLALAAERYFELADTVAALRAQRPGQMLDVHLADFTADPRTWLVELARFLGAAPPTEDYLEACSALVFDAPRRSRDQVAWEPALLDWIRDRSAANDFLARYAAETDWEPA